MLSRNDSTSKSSRLWKFSYLPTANHVGPAMCRQINPRALFDMELSYHVAQCFLDEVKLGQSQSLDAGDTRWKAVRCSASGTRPNDQISNSVNNSSRMTYQIVTFESRRNAEYREGVLGRKWEIDESHVRPMVPFSGF
jgi:hypothetical protein